MSEAELERFARRVHLDIKGTAADQAFVDTTRDQLQADGNTADARATVIDELMTDDGFAASFIDDVDIRAFGGFDYEQRFAILCNNQRQVNPACQACSGNADPCAGCNCPTITDMLAERTAIDNAADDFAAGASSSSIERRFVDSEVFRTASGLAEVADTLFTGFVGRPPEPDEVQNVSSMMVGITLMPGGVTGLLFHQHGSDYADLIDIIWTSEVYREAIVMAVFDRYLGRPATQVEIAYFSGQLDTADPDNRDVIRAVVSSGEYFNQ